VFEMFVQVDPSFERSQGGLGLGLTLVKSLIEMHGGNVEAHSDGEGKGTEFVVTLPAVDPPEATDAAVSTTPVASPDGRRVLVIDDNRESAESLASLPRMTGYEVRTAHDGHGGLSAAGEFAPWAVLCDIGMPGMSGFEVGQRLREGKVPTYLIALTGYGGEADRRRTREAGFDEHLVKPVDVDELESLLGRLAGGA